MGVEVILHPVMTHTIDRDVDIAISHATSAMMQCYVFDVNGLGAGGNGQSCVFDPSGHALFIAAMSPSRSSRSKSTSSWCAVRASAASRPRPDDEELPRPAGGFSGL